MDCAQLLILAPGVVTAIWAIVTFISQWQAKQKEEQKRSSALYTNPLLLACQELQSRLYNFQEKRDLGVLNAQDGRNHSHADETIYLVAQHSGWERYMFAYSPYARDIMRASSDENPSIASRTSTAGSPSSRCPLQAAINTMARVAKHGGWVIACEDEGLGRRSEEAGLERLQSLSDAPEYPYCYRKPLCIRTR